MRKRTAQFIEEQKAAVSSEGTRLNRKGNKRGTHPNSLAAASRNKAKPFPKGVSGNPGGLPGTDLGQKYAREFFERHPEGVSDSMAAELKGFNAYAFGVLADRGYGKVKDKAELEVSGKDGQTIEFKVILVKPKPKAKS